MKSDFKRNTLLIILCTLVSSSFVFFFKPIVNSDILESILDKDFEIISQKEPLLYKSESVGKIGSFNLIEKKNSTPKLSLIINEKHRIPIKFQERHGGLPIYLYKILNMVIPKSIAHGVWHTFWRILEIYLFYIFCVLFFKDPKWSLYTTLLYSLNASHLFTNFVFISEPMNSCGVLLIAFLLLRNRSKDFRWAMIITGFNFFIRLNFLWIAFLFIPLFFNKYKKRVLEGLFFVAIGAIPLFLTLDFGDLLFESGLVSQSYDISFLLKSLYRVILDPLSYLTFFMNVDHTSLSNSYLVIGLLSFLLVITTALYLKFVNIKNVVINLLLGLLLSLLTLYICVRAGMNYDLYTPYVIPFIFLIFSKMLQELCKFKDIRILVMSFTLVLLFQTTEVVIAYSKLGPAQIFDYQLQKEVTDTLIFRNSRKVLALSERTLGKMEFLSDENIDVKYIYPIFGDYKVHSVAEALMAHGEGGTLVVDQFDVWSNWYVALGQFDISKFYRNAGKYGIIVKDVKVVRKNMNEVYIIDYEISK